MYSVAVGGVIVLHFYSVVVYTVGSMRASRLVHARLLSSLLGSTFRWLDVTPISRVITRCTQDIQACAYSYAFLIALQTYSGF